MINELLKIKLYWNRASGHLGLPLAIFEKIALLVILLKMFNLYNNFILIIAVILMTGGFILIGWLDVRYGVFEKEQSLNNKYNKELQKILHKK